MAARTGRTPEQVLSEALAAFLAHEPWFAGVVEEGRHAMRRGELLDHEEVVGRLEERYRS